ncbi:unnamed protein product [Chrysoparadoxa australica]
MRLGLQQALGGSIVAELFSGTCSFLVGVSPAHHYRGGLAASRGEAESSVLEAGLVFPRDDGPEWFDRGCAAGARVQRYLHDEGDRWVMWYHARDEFFEEDDVVTTGTGRIGMARSSDGLTWTREKGTNSGGSVFDINSEQWWGFDTAAVGLGDITLSTSDRLQGDGGVYFLYYQGGSYHTIEEEALLSEKFGLRGASGKAGVETQIGVAVSQDGINWARFEGEHADGSCISRGEEGEWDSAAVGWPVVINHQAEEFRMYYHSFDASNSKHTIGFATSQDGVLWEKQGPVFTGGGEGSWDEMGAVRTDIIKLGENTVMFYEGVSADGTHAIGMATSADGRKWVREDSPVLSPSDVEGAWDSGHVSCPHLVDLDNGRYRLYYTGVAAGESALGPLKTRVGVAECVDNDLTKWARL